MTANSTDWSERLRRAKLLKTAAIVLIPLAIVGAGFVSVLGDRAESTYILTRTDSTTCRYDEALGRGPACSPPFNGTTYSVLAWTVLVGGLLTAALLFYLRMRTLRDDVRYITPVPNSGGTYSMGRRPPMPAASPNRGDSVGWKPDPYGRHELRYFDGSDWRADVSDGGVVSADPMDVPPPPTSLRKPE